MTLSRRSGSSKKAPKIVLGFYGVGEVGEKNFKALIADYRKGNDVATFVIPVTPELFNESMATVAEYAADNDIDIVAVATAGAQKDRGLKALFKDATDVVTAEDIGTALVNHLGDADNGVLFTLWDDDAEDDLGTYETVEYAWDNKIPIYDLCNGLEEVDLGDDKDDGDAGGDDDDEPEEKPARKGKADLKAVPDPEEPANIEGLPPYAEAVKMGVRGLRTIARDAELGTHRAIGSMDKAQVLELLYQGGGTGPVKSPVKPDDDDDDGELDATVSKAAQRSQRASKAAQEDEEPEEDEKPARRRRGAAAEVAHLNGGVVITPEAIEALQKLLTELAESVSAQVLAGLDK